jgi:hypothetical protein
VKGDGRHRSSNNAPGVVLKQSRSADSVLQHLGEQMDAEQDAAGLAVRGLAQVHGAYLVAFGGCAVATDASMHAMGSAWEDSSSEAGQASSLPRHPP